MLKAKLVAAWIVPVVIFAFQESTTWGQGNAAAPKVIETRPANGDREVAPDTKEIVVTFDQDMDPSGFSFVGGGQTFPKVTGQPQWRSDRQCVLPVQLTPGQEYALGVNNQKFTKFKNRQGVPAVPFTLSFRTRQSMAEPGESAPSAGKNAESVAQLREALARQYSYLNVRKVDWPAAWARYEPKLLAAGSAPEFARTAGEMLAATGDPHIWLTVGSETVAAFRRDVRDRVNVNAQILPGLIKDWKQPHPVVASGMAAPQIGYLAVHSWDRKHGRQVLDAALAALAEMRGQPALIVDVRLNSGGDETLAREFAAHFVRAKTVYARHVTLDPGAASGFSAPMDRWIEPAAGVSAYAGRVAVLMGPVNMSSAEAFLLMMQQAPNATLIGARSYGASGNPQPHALANGVTVFLPSWKAMLPDGTPFETTGIAPGIEVKTKPEDFMRRDPVLEKAIEILK